MAEVNIGTHHQKFNITIDTCSQHFWVFSDLTSPDFNHNRFCCKASDTCSFIKRTVDSTFGNKDITGSMVRDSVFAFDTEFRDFDFLAAHDAQGIIS